jgi:hypothetical protein
VFHGHAHHGKPEGKTTNGVPVYNVSMPLLLSINPEMPLRTFDVAVAAATT